MSVWDITGVFGFSEEIATAVFNAEMDPTSENLKAVVAAYAANGQTPPAKLMAYLVKRNAEEHPEDLYQAAWSAGAVIVGAAALWFIMRR